MGDREGKVEKMKTIQATDDLVIEIWEAGEACDRPVPRLRSRGATARRW